MSRRETVLPERLRPNPPVPELESVAALRGVQEQVCRAGDVGDLEVVALPRQLVAALSDGGFGGRRIFRLSPQNGTRGLLQSRVGRVHQAHGGVAEQLGHKVGEGGGHCGRRAKRPANQLDVVCVEVVARKTVRQLLHHAVDALAQADPAERAPGPHRTGAQRDSAKLVGLVDNVGVVGLVPIVVLRGDPEEGHDRAAQCRGERLRQTDGGQRLVEAVERPSKQSRLLSRGDEVAPLPCNRPQRLFGRRSHRPYHGRHARDGLGPYGSLQFSGPITVAGETERRATEERRSACSSTEVVLNQLRSAQGPWQKAHQEEASARTIQRGAKRENAHRSYPPNRGPGANPVSASMSASSSGW